MIQKKSNETLTNSAQGSVGFQINEGTDGHVSNLQNKFLLLLESLTLNEIMLSMKECH